MVRAEFDIFKLFLKTILDEKVDQAKRNRFAQAVHDGGTLTSKRKYQAFGIQFIDPSGVETLSYDWALSVVPTGQMLLSPINSATRCCAILVIILMTLFLRLSKIDVQR